MADLDRKKVFRILGGEQGEDPLWEVRAETKLWNTRLCRLFDWLKDGSGGSVEMGEPDGPNSSNQKARIMQHCRVALEWCTHTQSQGIVENGGTIAMYNEVMIHDLRLSNNVMDSLQSFRRGRNLDEVMKCLVWLGWEQE